MKSTPKENLLSKVLLFFFIIWTFYSAIRFGYFAILPPGMLPRDFEIHYWAVERLLNGIRFYDATDPSPFKYSPTFLLFFRYFMFPIERHWGWAIWCFAGTAAYCTSLWILLRRLLEKQGLRFFPAFVFFFIAGWRGFIEQHTSGQCDLFLFFFTITAFYLSEKRKTEFWDRHQIFAAFLLSLALLTKPQIALVFSYFVIRRNFHVLGWTAAITIFLFVLPLFYFGPHDFILFLRQWKDTLAAQDPLFMTGNANQSLAASLSRVVSKPDFVLVGTWLFVALAGIFTLAAALRESKSKVQIPFEVLSCLVQLLYLLSTPLSWRWLYFAWLPCALVFVFQAKKVSPFFWIFLGAFILVLQKNIAALLGIAEVDELSRYGLYTWATLFLFLNFVRSFFFGKKIKKR